MFVSRVDSLILLFLELMFLAVVWQSEMKSRNEKDRNHMPDSKGKIHELKILITLWRATKMTHRLVKKNLNPVKGQSRQQKVAEQSKEAP